MHPSAVIELGLGDEDSAAVLRKCQYGQLSLSTSGLLIAGKTQQELPLAALGLGAEDIGELKKAIEAQRALFAAMTAVLDSIL